MSYLTWDALLHRLVDQVDALRNTLVKRNADLAAARRENATLREALERIARSPDASSVKSDIARAALAASPAAEEEA